VENNEEKSAVEWLESVIFSMIMSGGDSDLMAVLEHCKKAKEMDNYNAKMLAKKYYLKGFEDAELTESQNCSHEQTMRDAETQFELVFEYPIKLK
jgi:hypothetical protein